MRSLCTYALKLTLHPWDMRNEDLDPLRRHGMTDRDIVDANQVVAYFNYVNRGPTDWESSWNRIGLRTYGRRGHTRYASGQRDGAAARAPHVARLPSHVVNA